jgi:hypothetical protein
MLESRVLLLRPAVAGQPRVIADAESGKPVGFTRLIYRPGWWDRVFGPVLFVHEREEEPLVFSVRRCVIWTQREVRDAEDERIGYLGPGSIRDRNRLLYAQTQADKEGLVYLCVNGAILAKVRHASAGLELSFTKVIEADPFAKMLVLAAALFQA